MPPMVIFGRNGGQPDQVPVRAVRLARSRLGNDSSRPHTFPTRVMARPGSVRYPRRIGRRGAELQALVTPNPESSCHETPIFHAPLRGGGQARVARQKSKTERQHNDKIVINTESWRGETRSCCCGSPAG